MGDRRARISWMASTIREIVRGIEPTTGRHDLVSSMGAAWAITLGGYPLTPEAAQLYERACAQRGLEARA